MLINKYHFMIGTCPHVHLYFFSGISKMDAPFLCSMYCLQIFYGYEKEENSDLEAPIIPQIAGGTLEVKF